MGRQKTNAIVIRSGDNEGIYFEHVPDATGRKALYKPRGVWLHVLKQNGDGYEPFEPSEAPVLLPTKLYRATRCEAARRLLADKKTTLEKVAMWSMIALAGIAALLVVIVLSEVSG